MALELQRTGRKGPRWERKPHPPEQKPERWKGRRPLELGGVGISRTPVGKKHRTTRREEEGGSTGPGHT